MDGKYKESSAVTQKCLTLEANIAISVDKFSHSGDDEVSRDCREVYGIIPSWSVPLTNWEATHSRDIAYYFAENV